MNRQDLRIRILDAVNEDILSPTFVSESQVHNAIQEAMEIMAEETNAIKRSMLIPLRKGSTFYYLRGIGQDMILPYRVWHHTLARPLTATSLQELDRRHVRWVDVTGDPFYWFGFSWDIFGVYPKPVAGGGIIRVDYMAWPRELIDDKDIPEFMESDQSAIVDYGAYDINMNYQDPQRAVAHLARFANQTRSKIDKYGVRRIQSSQFQTGQSEGFRSGIQH